MRIPEEKTVWYKGPEPEDKHDRELFEAIGERVVGALCRMKVWCWFIVTECRLTGPRTVPFQVTNIPEGARARSHAMVFKSRYKKYDAWNFEDSSSFDMGEVSVAIAPHNHREQVPDEVRQVIFEIYAEEMMSRRPERMMLYKDASRTRFSFEHHELHAERTKYRGDGIEFEGLPEDLEGTIQMLGQWSERWRKHYPNLSVRLSDMCYGVDGLPNGDGIPRDYGANKPHHMMAIAWGEKLDGTEVWRRTTFVVPYRWLDPELWQFEPGHVVVELSLPDTGQWEAVMVAEDFADSYARWCESAYEGAQCILVEDNGYMVMNAKHQQIDGAPKEVLSR